MNTTDGAELDLVLDELVSLGQEELAEELHQRVDFGSRPLPVLLAEREEGERVNARAPTSTGDATDSLAAFAMTERARQPPPFGPTPIAIHDDGDVPRNVRRDRGHGHIAGYHAGLSASMKGRRMVAAEG